jgi:hypothetical protein
MKVALVEMHVDREAPFWAILRSGPKRLVAVTAALQKARCAGAALVLFPGWTVARQADLSALLPDTEGITAVLEVAGDGDSKRTAKGSRPGRTYVVANGKVIAGPIEQRIMDSKDVRRKPTNVRLLRSELNALRVFDVAGRRFGVLICGETNVMKAKGGHRGKWNQGAECFADLDLSSIDVILNPAHTRTRLPRMHQKASRWAALTRGKLVLHTANADQKHFHRNISVAAAYGPGGKRSRPTMKVEESGYNVLMASV